MTRHEVAIREDVREAFATFRELDDSNIWLFVRDGVVTLHGDVDDHHAAWCAVRAAWTVRGVIHVRSMLLVRPEIADEHAPLETEFGSLEDARFMVSPGYRWLDAI